MFTFLLTLSALAGVPEDAKNAVELHRDALVLAASVDGLTAGQRRDVPILGKFLLEDRLEVLASLNTALLDDVPRDNKGKAKQVYRFLDLIEGSDFRDGDKLVFRETLARLQSELEAAPAGKRRDDLLARVKADRAAISEVEERYREEMRKLLGKLRTRGMKLSREAWDNYIEAISAGRSVDDIFGRHAAELSANVGGTRGSGDNELEIYGTSLPDKTFVITYDDGPHDVHTASILDALAEHEAKGVFFQVGRNVGTIGEDGVVTEKPAARHTRRLVEEGHLLASHTWSHKNLPKQSDDGLDDQLDLADQVLDSVSGTDVVLVRPPYGAKDGRVLDALQERNTRAYLWNIDSMDWADPIPESIAQTVYEQVTAQGHGVILLHDVHEQSAKATPLILDLLEKDGYKLVLWDGESVYSDSRGASAEAKTASAPEASGLYENSWAVVIGINDYTEWPRLAYAVHDAEGVRDKLIERFGFREDRIIELTDAEATRDNILRVLGDDLPGKVSPDDRVFVFYAGHGATRALPGGSERGYIIPVDGDLQNLTSTAISMSQLQDVQEAIPAKHVLFVMDACYSGIALTRAGGYTGDPRRYLKEVTRRNARQILTAGGADEQVSDHGPGGHSIFTWTVLQGMDGPADLNGDGFITATELSGFVAPRVSSLSKQTPAFGNLVGSQGGEFVLTLDADETLLSELSTGKTNADALARAKALLASENEELQAQVAAMAAELSKLKGTRGGNPDVPDLVADAKQLHEHGLLKFREGEIALAYEAIKKAAELDPKNVEIVNNLGFVLQQLGRHEEAVPHFQTSIELDANRAVAYLNLGDSQAAIGARDEAVAAYGQYLEMVPDSRVKGRIRAYIENK